MARGRRTRRPCSPRSPRTASGLRSSRSASTPPGSPGSSSRWQRLATRSAPTPGRTRICRKNPRKRPFARSRWATAPFFRFPALRHPPEMVKYLGERNIAIFSTDMDSFDFTMRKPEQVIKSVMGKLEKHGKGIVLMHDFQRATAEAVPELLNQLKANGYKIVHMVPRAPMQTIAQYDEMVMKENKLPTVSSRPTESVIRTISEMPR